jgi:hypothetical protein
VNSLHFAPGAPVGHGFHASLCTIDVLNQPMYDPRFSGMDPARSHAGSKIDPAMEGWQP